MRNKNVVRLTQAAVIAAMYAALTIAQNYLIPGSASAAIQFRVAEVLTILAVFTPVAIPGLTLGCVIANISSVVAGFGFYDMIFGSLASLMATLTMYGLRNVRIKKIPFAAALMPALWNGLIVGLEIAIFLTDTGFTFNGFLITGGCVALGELAVLFILGLPFCKVIEKTCIFKGKQFA